MHVRLTLSVILLRTEKAQVQTAVLQLEVCQYIENKYGIRGPRKLINGIIL